MAFRREDSGPLHDEEVLDRVDADRAWSLVARMDPACRSLIRWRLLDNYDYEAISSMTGVKVATLRRRFFDCMGRLREMLRQRP